MKNSIIKILPAIMIISIIWASCSTTAVSHYSRKSATSNVRYVNQSSIIQMPLLADLEIDESIVTGSYSGTGVAEEFAKSMAVSNAIKKSSSDVLIEPIYYISVEDDNITVEVRGHPAKYKNFRQPQGADDKGSNSKLNYVKPDPNKTKNRY